MCSSSKHQISKDNNKRDYIKILTLSEDHLNPLHINFHSLEALYIDMGCNLVKKRILHHIEFVIERQGDRERDS